MRFPISRDTSRAPKLRKILPHGFRAQRNGQISGLDGIAGIEIEIRLGSPSLESPLCFGGQMTVKIVGVEE